MVRNFHQIADFPVRIFRQLYADLNINLLIPAFPDKVNFLRPVFSDINLIAAALHLQEYNILQRAVQHLPVIAQKAVFQRDIRKIIFFLCLQNIFSLNIIPMTGVDDKCLLQPAQIIVDGFH